MKTYLYKETFNADAPLRVDSIRINWQADDSADVSDLQQDYADCEPGEAAKYRQQDKERLDAFNRGEWYMRGCTAIAEVSYPIGQGSRRIEHFSSGGLWGIESDCGADYEAETVAGQLDDLKQHLAAFGVPWPANATELLKGGAVSA